MDAVTVDAEGYVWLGSFRGLRRWDKHRLSKPISPLANGAVVDVARLVPGAAGGIWLLERRAGLFHKARGSWQLQAIDLGEEVSDIAAGVGVLLVASGSGVAAVEFEKDGEVVVEPVVTGVAVSALSSDGLWAATESGLVLLGGEGSGESGRVPLDGLVMPLATSPVGELLVAHKGRDGKGLSTVFADGRLKALGFFASTRVHDAVVVGEQVWVATGEGLFLVEEHEPASVVVHGVVRDVFVGPQGLWAASTRGLFKVRQERVAIRPVPSLGELVDVMGFLPTEDGDWFGTLGGLIHYPHGGTGRGEVVSSKSITALVQTPRRVFAGTFNSGLLLVAGDGAPATLEVQTAPDADHAVTSLLMSGGQLWIGTYSEGLWALDLSAEGARPRLVDETERTFALAAAESSGAYPKDAKSGWLFYGSGNELRRRRADGDDLGAGVVAVAADTIRSLLVRGTEIWVGTNSGLEVCAPDGKRYACRSAVRDPAAVEGSKVVSLFLAPDDAVWFATTSVLHRLDPASGDVQSLAGAGSHPPSGWHPASLYSSSAGRHFLGGPDGLFEVDPTAAVESAVAPLRITDVRVGGERVSGASELTLGRSDTLEVEFSLLDYSDTTTLYSFRIDDEEWSTPAPTPSVTLSRLPAGRHRLELRAVGRGVDDVATLALTVLAHPLLTVPALVAYAVLASLLVFVVGRALHRRRQEAETSERAAKEASNDLALLARRYKVVRLQDGATGLPHLSWMLWAFKFEFEALARSYLGPNPRPSLHFVALIVDGTDELIAQLGFNEFHQLLADLGKSFEDASGERDLRLARGERAAFIALTSKKPEQYVKILEESLEAHPPKQVNADPPDGHKISLTAGWAPYPWLPANPFLIEPERAALLAEMAALYSAGRGRGGQLGFLPGPRAEELKKAKALVEQALEPAAARRAGVLTIDRVKDPRRRGQLLRFP